MGQMLFVRYRDNETAQFTVDDEFAMKEFSADYEGIAWEFDDGGGLYLRLEDVRSAYLVQAAQVVDTSATEAGS